MNKYELYIMGCLVFIFIILVFFKTDKINDIVQLIENGSVIGQDVVSGIYHVLPPHK